MEKFIVITYRLIAVLAVFVVAGSGCAGKRKPEQNPPPTAAAEAPLPAPPAEERPKLKATMEQVTLRWQEANKPRLVATASRAVGDEMAGTGALEDVSADLYRDGRKSSVLRAPRVEANRPAGTLVATGGAVLESVERQTVVRCPQIEWDANNHRITGTGGVTVDSQTGRIEADSFTADTDLRTIEFHSGGARGRALIGNR